MPSSPLVVKNGSKMRLAHLLRHADAGVGHGDDDVAVIAAARVRMRQRAALRHRVDRVQDEVGDDLVQLGRAAHDDGHRAELELELQREAARGSSSPPSAAA